MDERPRLDKARREWLLGLTAGDEVAVVWRDSGRVDIERIADAAGEMVCIGDPITYPEEYRDWFYRTGRLAGAAGGWSGPRGGGVHIEPLTDNMRRRARLSAYCDRLFDLGQGGGFDFLPDDQIQAIARVLGWEAAE